METSPNLLVGTDELLYGLLSLVAEVAAYWGSFVDSPSWQSGRAWRFLLTKKQTKDNYHIFTVKITLSVNLRIK